MEYFYFEKAKLTHQIGSRENRIWDLKRSTLSGSKPIPLDQSKWVKKME
jgi:hypothetical protein